MTQVIKLSELASQDIPEKLTPAYYFDLAEHRFAHAALLTKAKSVVDVLGSIGQYAKSWLRDKADQIAKSKSVTLLTEKDFPNRSVGRFRALLAKGAQFDPSYCLAGPDGGTICLDAGAKVLGAVTCLDSGDIYIGSETTVEPCAGIRGPAIVMEGNEIRQGAYFRGNVIVGSNSSGAALRGELKNVVLMNEANFPHPCYLGDSLCGFATHFGNQVTAANLGIFQGLRDRAARTNIIISLDDVRYDLGLTKMGVIMGDYSQIGCNSVVAPGTLLGRNCVAYALCMIDRGLYESNTLFKNKPLAGRVMEVTAVDPQRV